LNRVENPLKRSLNHSHGAAFPVFSDPVRATPLVRRAVAI
jgi:hypothetical protein